VTPTEDSHDRKLRFKPINFDRNMEITNDMTLEIHNSKFYTDQVGVVVKLETCVREVPCSNLDRYID
jgi:hypothetical protein